MQVLVRSFGTLFILAKGSIRVPTVLYAVLFLMLLLNHNKVGWLVDR